MEWIVSMLIVAACVVIGTFVGLTIAVVLRSFTYRP